MQSSICLSDSKSITCSDSTLTSQSYSLYFNDLLFQSEVFLFSCVSSAGSSSLTVILIGSLYLSTKYSISPIRASRLTNFVQTLCPFDLIFIYTFISKPRSRILMYYRSESSENNKEWNGLLYQQFYQNLYFTDGYKYYLLFETLTYIHFCIYMGSCTTKNDLVRQMRTEQNNTRAGRPRSGSFSSRVQRPPALIHPFKHQSVDAEFRGLRPHSNEYFDALLDMNEQQAKMQAYSNNPLVHSPLKQYIKYQLSLIQQKRNSEQQTACQSKKEPSIPNDSLVRQGQKQSQFRIKLQNIQNNGGRHGIPHIEQSLVQVKSTLPPLYEQSRVSIKLG